MYALLHSKVSSAKPLFPSSAFCLLAVSSPLPSVDVLVSRGTTVTSKEVSQGPSGLLCSFHGAVKIGSSCPASQKQSWSELDGAFRVLSVCCSPGRWENQTQWGKALAGVEGGGWAFIPAHFFYVCVWCVFTRETYHLKNSQEYPVWHFGSFIQYPKKINKFPNNYPKPWKSFPCVSPLSKVAQGERRRKREEGYFRPWSLGGAPILKLHNVSCKSSGFQNNHRQKSPWNECLSGIDLFWV